MEEMLVEDDTYHKIITVSRLSCRKLGAYVVCGDNLNIFFVRVVGTLQLGCGAVQILGN